MQVDDYASVVEPSVVGARRGSWHLDLSFSLRVGIFRRRPPDGIERGTETAAFSNLLRVSRSPAAGAGSGLCEFCRSVGADMPRLRRAQLLRD